MNCRAAIQYLHERHPDVIDAPGDTVDLEALHLDRTGWSFVRVVLALVRGWLFGNAHGQSTTRDRHHRAGGLASS